MVISGSFKHSYTQLGIQRRIRPVLICRYTEASSSLVYSINYKNDNDVLGTALETPNRLSNDHYVFWKNKGDYYQIPPNKPQTN